MISDNLLERNPQWQAIANAGIGGPVPYVAPTVYTVTPATDQDPFLTVTITGSSYTDMMAATHRPLMPAFFPNAIYYDFCFEIMTRAGDPIQALECEASYSYMASEGVCWYCNNSLQFNYNAGGMVQAFTPSNPWTDTGLVLKPFAPGEAVPVKISYMVDTVNNVYSTLSLTVNGVTYPLPSQFQGIAATNKSPAWAPGVYAQFQSDLDSQGGTIVTKFSNISVNWI